MNSSNSKVQPTANSEASTKSSVENITQDAILPVAYETFKADVEDPTELIASTQDEEQRQDKDALVSTTTTGLQKLANILRWFVKDQWFLLAMGAIILVSSQVQVPEAQQRVKRTVVTYLAVSVIFFVNGCTLSTRVLFENYMRWKLHAFVQLQCYLVTSAATFAIVSLCATNPHFST